MKRRTFLRMLSLAPVAAALPAMALPRPDNVKDTVKGSVTMGDRAWSQSQMFLDVSQAGPSKIVIDYDALNRDLEKTLIYKDGKFWINPANIDVSMYDPRKHGGEFNDWRSRGKT